MCTLSGGSWVRQSAVRRQRLEEGRSDCTTRVAVPQHQRKGAGYTWVSYSYDAVEMRTHIRNILLRVAGGHSTSPCSCVGMHACHGGTRFPARGSGVLRRTRNGRQLPEEARFSEQAAAVERAQHAVSGQKKGQAPVAGTQLRWKDRLIFRHASFAE